MLSYKHGRIHTQQTQQDKKYQFNHQPESWILNIEKHKLNQREILENTHKHTDTYMHTHTKSPVACMLIQPLSPSSSSFHLPFPLFVPLSSFIPPCLPPSLDDLHYAALINTPLFLASCLLNVKTGNQRVTFHLEWKSKVPGRFSALCRRAGQCSADKSRGKSSTEQHSVAWNGTEYHKHCVFTAETSPIWRKWQCCWSIFFTLLKCTLTGSKWKNCYILSCCNYI